MEYEILQILWRAAPVTVGEVRSGLNDVRDDPESLAYTTVMTVLTRLMDKGLVEREKVGRGFTYTPLYDESELVAHLGRQEIDQLVDRYGSVALAQFAEVLEGADPALLRRLTDLASQGDNDET